MRTSALEELQSNYLSLINSITYNGSIISVYEEVPKNATYPYIQFNGYTETDDSTKSDFADEIFLSLKIVDRYSLTTGTKKKIASIWSDLKGIITSRISPFTCENYDVIISVTDNFIIRKEYSQTHIYIIGEARFKHNVRKK